MKQILTLLLFCLVAGRSDAAGQKLSAEETKVAYTIYNRIFPRRPEPLSVTLNRNELRSLQASDRELVKQLIRDYNKTREQKNERETARSSEVLYLALLGDDWAREMVVLGFWYESGHQNNTLLLLQDPKTLPMLGEGLFMEEVPYAIEDVRYLPPQYSILEVFGRVLVKSPEFSPEVTAWAQRNMGKNGDQGHGDTLAIMREWYRANEARLKAGNFAAVEPGRDSPEILQPESLPLPASSTEPPPNPNALSGGAKTGPSGQSLSPGLASPVGGVGPWLAVATGLLLMVFGAVIWKRQQSR